MESNLDHSTGRPLPPDAIQRVLFLSPTVHIYNIPPLTSTKGYIAAGWTADPARQIFTACLRILETAVPNPMANHNNNEPEESVKTDILLEDSSSGQLFAAAPYTTAGVVEQVLDSSRFFALRVQGEGGRKAVLGIGFEERSEAFDFSVALQEVRRTLGLETQSGLQGQGKSGKSRDSKGKGEENSNVQREDFSLKEGQTITVNIGARKARRERSDEGAKSDTESFSLPPPPGFGSGGQVGGFGLLPPPPSAREVKAQKRLSQNMETPQSEFMQDLGFDDGEFGEFQ